MFKNHFFRAVFVLIYFGLHGSERGMMSVTVTNNSNLPSLDVELKDKISRVHIVAQRNDIQNPTFEVNIDNETSKTIIGVDGLKKYEAMLGADLELALKYMTQGELAHKQGAYHITRTDNNVNSTYQTLSRVFKQLISYHWTILPSSGNMNIDTLHLKYPKGTTALDLKKIIYEKIAENDDRTEIQNKMYNILIKFDAFPLKDNDEMRDIDSLDIQESQSFSLTLSKTLFQFFYIDNTFKLSFINPPSLSIDKKPVINNFAINLQNIDKTDTKINVKYDGEELSTVVSDTKFVSKLNDYYLKNKESINTTVKNDTVLQHQLTFFKTAFIEWAKKANKEVSFQGEQLYPKSAKTDKLTAGARPTLKQYSWLSSGLQRVKSFFSTAKNRAFTILVGLGIVAGAGLAYKNVNTNWFSNWFKPQPTTSPTSFRQTPVPTIPNIPKQ